MKTVGRDSFLSPKTPKNTSFLGVTQPPGVAQPLYSRGHNQTQTYNICPSLIEIGSKTAEKNSAQTNKQTSWQTDRQTNSHYENNGHLAVNQLIRLIIYHPMRQNTWGLAVQWLINMFFNNCILVVTTAHSKICISTVQISQHRNRNTSIGISRNYANGTHARNITRA